HVQQPSKVSKTMAMRCLLEGITWQLHRDTLTRCCYVLALTLVVRSHVYALSLWTSLSQLSHVYLLRIDPQLLAVIFCNRATALHHLKLYTLALQDARYVSIVPCSIAA